MDALIRPRPLLLLLLAATFFLGALVKGVYGVITVTPPSVPRDPREICETEEFAPKCSDDEVVMVTDAWYGRMELAYCVRMNYGEVGCRADARDHLDRECSGRRTCSLRIPDTVLESLKTCPREFKNYLNVSYTCIPVENASCLSCDTQPHARVTHQRAYIASASTFSSPNAVCGTTRCPWRIEVPSGQTINITLLDFSLEHHRILSPDACLRYALIREASSTKDTPVCGRRKREQQVYASIGNIVDIHVMNMENPTRSKDQFLLHYEAVGCPDLDPPPNAWSRRTGDKTTVGCRDSGQTWESRCVGTRWDGNVGNCPGMVGELQTSLPIGVLIAIVLGIALVIGVLIVTVGVVCLRRHRNEQQRPETILYGYPGDGQCYELRDDSRVLEPLRGGAPKDPSHMRGTLKPGGYNPLYAGESGAGGPPGRENLYAHGKMDARPLPSIPPFNGAETSKLDVDAIGSLEYPAMGNPIIENTIVGSSTEGNPVVCDENPPAGNAVTGNPIVGNPAAGNLVMGNPATSGLPSACPLHMRVMVRTGRPGPQVPAKPVRSSFTGLGNSGGGAPSQRIIPTSLQHYTVLDASEAQPHRGEGIGAPPSPPLPPWPGVGGSLLPPEAAGEQGATMVHPSRRSPPGGSGGVGGEDQRGGVGGCGSPNGEEGHASNQEIALRPARDGPQPKIDAASCGGGSGNSSWP